MGCASASRLTSASRWMRSIRACRLSKLACRVCGFGWRVGRRSTQCGTRSTHSHHQRKSGHEAVHAASEAHGKTAQGGGQCAPPTPGQAHQNTPPRQQMVPTSGRMNAHTISRISCPQKLAPARNSRRSFSSASMRARHSMLPGIPYGGEMAPCCHAEASSPGICLQRQACRLTWAKVVKQPRLCSLLTVLENGVPSDAHAPAHQRATAQAHIGATQLHVSPLLGRQLTFVAVTHST